MLELLILTTFFLFWRPLLVYTLPACNLQANCSSWGWSTVLTTCPSDSQATLPCSLSDIPPFALEDLVSSSLVLPNCSAQTFQWQSLFTTGSQQVDISNCPLTCSCDTNWVGIHLEHLNVLPPKRYQCNPACESSTLLHLNTSEPTVGKPYVVEYLVKGPIVPAFLSSSRRYFKWHGSSGREHNHTEVIRERSIRLEISNVTEADIGVVNVICWHCKQPLFSYFQIGVPSPLSLKVDSSEPSSFRLTVEGHPIDQLVLTVSDEKGENITHELPPISSSSSTYYWDMLVVRQDNGHSLFHRRVFDIFTKSCTDCPEDHLSGDFTFTICSSQDPDAVNGTVETKCRSITHHFNRYNATDLVHVQAKYDAGPSLEPFVIMLLIVVSLLMAVAFIHAKLHNIKSVGWRKWRWSFHSRLSRRTSHATEETMLRLEERLSMSSSDYTGHIIPCIKGGAVQIHEQIGKGAFGAVYCGSWEQTGPRSVAVKALVEADAEVEKEATVLCRLDHDNIVRLYGLTRDVDRLLLVFEMMRLGDLRSYLKARAPQPGSYASFPAALDQSELKFIVRQVARGLCYLVAQQIVHRDLAARNCLVDGESDQMVGNPSQRPPISVKISDFGMSRRLTYHSDYYRMQNQSLLPVRWLPPEAISDHRFSSKSDIWSLGVTMWEIFSYGSVPFDTLSNHEVVSYALAGMRPLKPSSCPNDVYALMERCWTLDPEQRLTAEDVLLDPAIAEKLEVGPL